MQLMRFQMSIACKSKADADASYSTTLEADDMLDVVAALRAALEPFKPAPQTPPAEPA